MRVGGFCLELRAEQDPEQEGWRSVNAAGGNHDTSHWTSERSQSFHGTSEYRSAAVYWFCFRWIPRGPGSYDVEREGEGEGEGERRWSAAGVITRVAMPVVTPSYSRVKRGKVREENSAWRTYVCNYAVPSFTERHAFLAFSGVSTSADRPERGKGANRDKTNLGGVRSLPILFCLLSNSSPCFSEFDWTTDTNNDNGANRRQWDWEREMESASEWMSEWVSKRERERERERRKGEGRRKAWRTQWRQIDARLTASIT